MGCAIDSYVGLGNWLMPCQEELERYERVDEIAKWFETRDEDVIMVQELFTFHSRIRNAMYAASYCHYVATTSGLSGSGLAIYSKYPIEEDEFLPWPDYGTNSESMLDSKGVLYAKIRKGEEYVHVFNLHTTSTTNSGSQSDRDDQFIQTRSLIDQKQINSNELILIGGDFNQNKYAEENGQENYENMLGTLHAAAFERNEDQFNYTYDTVANALTRSKYYEGETHQELLDYILYDTESVIPNDESSCEIIRPVSTITDDTDDPKSMLSDHLPVTCTISYTTENPNPPTSDSPMFFAEVTVRRASVCQADTWGGGYSDTFINIRIFKNGEVQAGCGTTTTINDTNDPVWEEMISCSNVQFQATDRILITFDAYDGDSGFNGSADFIGTGSIAVTPSGVDFNGDVKLEHGDCDENGHLEYRIELKQVS